MEVFILIRNRKEIGLSETIAAISTATGPGGIGIVRLSGDQALEIGQKMFQTIDRKPLDLDTHP